MPVISATSCAWVTAGHPGGAAVGLSDLPSVRTRPRSRRVSPFSLRPEPHVATFRSYIDQLVARPVVLPVPATFRTAHSPPTDGPGRPPPRPSDFCAADDRMILIVDDHPDTCGFLVRLLGKRGYAATCAASGEAALAALAGVRPSLIVLDYMMPGMSGLDVLRRIRSDAALAAVPV